MKIFFAHEDPWNAGNPYIYTLIEATRESHPDDQVAWGRPLFWSNEIFSFDIVHFQWPQSFITEDHTEAELRSHLEKMKEKGVTIAATCHDLKPHYNQCAEKAWVMPLVYSSCDAIFHLGDYSKQLFEQQYPHARHLLLPHHIYDTIYHLFPSKEESLRHLNLPEDQTYILCFGTFRSDEERQLVISLYRQLDNENVSILAPGFMDVKWMSPNFPVQLFRQWYYRHKYHIYSKGKTWGVVSDEDLPYYYGAADVCFIQRVKILNSGNAMLPMLYGKVVVGPDTGNVGPLLREWGYPVFDTGNTNGIGEVVKRAIQLQREGFGSLHSDEHLARYSTASTAEKLYTYYKQLVA